MFSTAETATMQRLLTGRPDLDALLGVSGGILTLRSPSARWLSWLACSIIARNARPESRILYLQWADYHDRYWSIDFDLLVGLGKRAGADLRAVEDNTLLLRVFSRDGVEEEANWRRIFSVPGGFSCIILDSVDGAVYYSSSLRKPKPPAVEPLEPASPDGVPPA
ncbi:MAG: hypothetical protein V1787_02270 [Candidatus Micrarchaeota archaeon]